MASNFNQQSLLATGAPGGYQAGGFLYGYGDPIDQSKSTTNFSNNLTPFVAGGNIIPSQYTMTAAQSVGPAQFGLNGTSTTMGQKPVDNFTQGPAVIAQQASSPSANQAFMFGNNGSAGSLAGTFGSTAAGQSSPFYQSQPQSLNQSNPSMGTFQPITPQQQALIQSR